MKKKVLVSILLAILVVGCFAFTACGEKASEGLKFELSEDGNSYILTGIGTCLDSNIVIPTKYEGKSVTSIGNKAFSLCTGIKSITIPDSVKSIGERAFAHCYTLSNITIPSGLTSLGDGAFIACYGLTSITIPSSITSIGDSVFSSCKNLSNVIIPSSVTRIGDAAFSECAKLTSITIPSSVTSIGMNAFLGCNKLTNATFEDPNGWYRTSTKGATSGTRLILTDAAQSAVYLTEYNNQWRYWYKSNQSTNN